MKLSPDTHKKLMEFSETSLANWLGISMQLVQYYQKTGRVPDALVLPLQEIVGFKIHGEWKEGKRSVCGKCNCVKICK